MPGRMPLRCALIGIGMRARKLYLPLARAIAPWLTYSAVVSPDPANAAEAGMRLGVPHFTSLEPLLDADLVDAALVLSSIDSHYALSVLLSEAGIHHLVETPLAATLTQAAGMVETAERAGVTLHVAENYFRFPFDRLARRVVQSGAIGDVARVTCFHDQVGWHGHARWLKFYDAYPEAVQSLVHVMPTERHRESERRVHESEAFRSCHLFFPGGRVAIDMGGNLKGLLGRTPRPGLTEIAGARGTIRRIATAGLGGDAELRIASDAALEHGGRPDHVAPFVDEVDDATWVRSSVALPEGMAEWLNPYRPGPVTGPKLREWDAAVVMEILVQFAEAASAGNAGEFSARDALKTTEIEMALRESAADGGRRIALPVAPDGLGSEAAAAEAIRERTGFDPLDARALAAVHFPAAL